jgi:hypothetical protein
MSDVFATFLALCGATILWVLGIMWYLDLFNSKHQVNNDQDPPTFI